MARPGEGGIARRRIGIASPVSLAAEVEPLVRSGASELYCGVSVESWGRRFGSLAWLNRRGAGAANPNRMGLERLLAEATRLGVPVGVTLNSPYYTAQQLPDLVALCGDLQAAGVARVIVADPSLIVALREAGSSLPITASSVAALRNAGALELYRDLGASRVVLPRHMTVDEVVRIRERVADLELEVFVLNDGCAYEEGSCATTHAAGAFCLTEWRWDFARLDAAPLGDADREALERNVDDYRDWLWHLANCGRSLAPGRLPEGPCGLCAIHAFATAGIDCLKVVGREAHPGRKLLSVQLVRAVVDRIAEGATAEEATAFARGLRDAPERCDGTFMCYYRPSPA